MIRHAPCYRRDAFEAGLEAAGYAVHAQINNPTPDDVLVIWNRYGRFEQAARGFEICGAQVLVVENGYAGCDKDGRQYYAIAREHHNGGGSYEAQECPRRWIGGIELSPWRQGGKEVVVLAQRGIGEPGIAQPRNWPALAESKLRQRGFRVRVRAHPGTRDAVPLLDDLADAQFCATWASGAAVKALIAGIPVLHGFKRWIARPAASYGLDASPKRCGRGAMLAALSWAQWTLDEIASGKPIRLLCQSS